MNTNRFINVDMKFQAVLPGRSPSTFKATKGEFNSQKLEYIEMLGSPSNAT